MSFLVEEPIRLDTLIAAVASPSHGAVATFTGIVRNHQDGRQVVRLEYSAYGPMAEQECERIAAEAEMRWPVCIRLRHRVGTLVVGDVAVAVAAGSAHRDEAFAACRYAIEQVKRRLPIWKREHYADGTVVWVEPTASPGPAERP